jgi:hypothetical protein
VKRLAALVVLAACSGLTDNEDGVASLEIRYPANTFLEAGTTVRLAGIARNAAGDSVDVAIRWRTPDTTVAIDSVTGLVAPLASSGSARIQAAVFGKDTIVTTLAALTLTLTARADSLVLTTPDSLDLAHDTSTAVIRTRFLGGAPAVGIFNRPLALRIVEPAPADSPAVAFRSGRTADSTNADQTGATASTLRAVRGRQPPDRVVVELAARRADGQPIPGSGHRIVIRFRHQ